MNELPSQYLNEKEALQKYSFLTKNILKNLLFKNLGGFREKVVRKLGRRNIFDEQALLQFLADSKEEPRPNRKSKKKNDGNVE